ncbi:nucleoside hydrolase [Endozoicomonas lisbonensis]|uniref:Purine nucleosidase n=1 Tax=Endozoicomonas lisbonensis TaxID=3120522 RepID=A0ABV2SNL1_9GAMM
MNTNIIIDTDPGIDDAIALLLAAASPELTLTGVTTVGGNVSQQQAFINAQKILQAAGKRVPVYRGCEQAISRPLKPDTEVINGQNGLGDIDWPEAKPGLAQSTNAVDFIITRAQVNNPVTLCMLGPLTNLALALVINPDIAAGIHRVVIMGGALKVSGNVSAVAEFNFHTDPVAADIVFRSPLNITLCPLDVTETLKWRDGWLEPLLRGESKAAQLTAEMLGFYRAGEGGGLHDPVVIASLIKPEIMRTRPCDIHIETRDEGLEGQSRAVWSDSGKVRAVMEADVDTFFNLLGERLMSLP